MGQFKKAAAKALDDAAAAVVFTGQTVGGRKGERLANAAAAVVFGRHYCPPGEKCRHYR